jgi:eight-cysteine-cluster-containing protein
MQSKVFAAAVLCLSLAACAPAAPAGGGSSSSSAVPVAERYVDPKCQVGGCSAQICQGIDKEPAMSDCMFRPAYECYKVARCEPQATGECGWTMTSELSACLMDPPEIDASSVSA